MGRRFIFAAALGAALLAAGRGAWALIELKKTVNTMYDASKPVVIGTVSKVNPESRLVEVKTTETVKGDPFPEQFRVQVPDQIDFVKGAAAGQPVVLMGSKVPGKVVLNFGDAWLLGTVVPNANPPAWRASVLKDDTVKAFPGRTDALVKVVAELKAGKPTLLNAVDNKRLRGEVKEAAKLPVSKPTFLLAVDVNGDKKPDLVVGTASGVKLFLAGASGYEDATAAWGLAGATGTEAAAADVNHDGKIDLLVGNTLWINEGQKFTAAKGTLDIPTGVPVAAEGLLDVNGDTKPDAVVLLADGQLLTFTNLGTADQPWTKGPGRKLGAGAVQTAVFGDFGDNSKPCVIAVSDDAVTRYPIDADGGAPADFYRLTGDKLELQKGFGGGTKNATAGVLDLNGDGRPDVAITADGGALVLVNRGFGAYLVDPDAGAPLSTPADKGLPFKVTAATPWAAADLTGDGTSDLLVLAEDGRLFVVDNPPVPPGK